MSRVGDFLYEFAIAIWVRDATDSALMVGLVLFASLVPTVLLSLFGGAFVDRSNRVQVMLVSDIGRALVAGLVALLAYSDHLTFAMILVASAVYGMIDAFFQPAFFASIPELTPESDLTSANALTSISSQFGRVIGPPLGAFLLAFSDFGGVFGINAATFLFSAMLLIPLRNMVSVGAARPEGIDGADQNGAEAGPNDPSADEGSAGPSSEDSSFMDEIREGFAFLRTKPWIWIGTLVIALGNIGLAGPFVVAMPFLFKNDLQLSDQWYGLVLAFFPIGYVLAGLWMGRKETLRRRGLTAYLGSISAGVMLAMFGMSLELESLLRFDLHPVIVPLCVAALINGAGLEVFTQVWMQTMQEMVPIEMLGRISSIVELGTTVMLPVGLALAGIATDAFGAEPVFLIGGLGTALISLIAYAHPAIRGLD